MKIQRLIGVLLVVALISMAQAQSPTSAEDFLKRGGARVEQGKLDEAISDYTRAIEINSALAPGSLCRSEEVIISDLFNALALNNRGFAYYRKGDWEQAIADFDLAIRMQPRLADVFNNRGNVWQARGDWARALADFNQAIKLNPRHRFAYNNRANVHQALGNLTAAIADYGQAVKFNPNSATAFANRGLTLLQLGNDRDARADFKRALELAPELKPTLERLIQSEAGLAGSPEQVLSTTNTKKEKP